MCTLVLLSRPGHAWPLLVAANRDESLARPWRAPAAHWPGRPGVVGGLDLLGGGTWMAARGGLVAAVLNRRHSLGPAPGKRSRGDLPLDALGHPTARDAVRALSREDAGAFRPFNLVVADREGAFLLRGLGEGRPDVLALSPGLHMVTAFDPDDPASARVRRHLPRFRDAVPPEPPGWGAWRDLLLDGSGPAGSEIHVPAEGGFGTVCSSLLGVDAAGERSWVFEEASMGSAQTRQGEPPWTGLT
ncbi:MAG: NRDE family protein [Janthinobacterium lividum]